MQIASVQKPQTPDITIATIVENLECGIKQSKKKK